MGLLLLTKIKYMPYGPTCKEQIYALWVYSQRTNICLMGLLTKNKYIHCPMSLHAKLSNIIVQLLDTQAHNTNT